MSHYIIKPRQKLMFAHLVHALEAFATHQLQVYQNASVQTAIPENTAR